MIGLILVLLLSRTAALAFVETFALRITFSPEYMQYNYPLLLMVVGLLLLDPASPFRMGQAAHRTSKLSAGDGKQAIGQQPSA